MLYNLLLAAFVILIAVAAPAGEISPAGESLLEKANSFYRSNEYGKAVDVFREYLATEGDSYHVRVGLGRSYMELNEKVKAREEFEHAMKLDPQGYEAPLFYGDSWMQDDHQKGIDYIRQALAINPDIPIAYRWIGIAYVSFGQYDQAIAILREGAERLPASEEILQALAYAYYSAKKYPEAREVFALLREKFPSSAVTNLRESILESVDGNLSRARELLEETGSDTSEKGLYAFASGVYHVANRENDKGLEAFVAATKESLTTIDFFIASLNAGTLYLAKGEPKNAMTHLANAGRAAQSLPGLPRSEKAVWRLRLGMALSKLENFEDAKDFLEEARTLGNKSLELYLTLANAYLRLDNPDASLRISAEGNGIHKDNLGIGVNVGSALVKLGRSDEAKLVLEQVVIRADDAQSDLREAAKKLLADIEAEGSK